MKITIESTTQIIELNGVPGRVWEGTTETGVKVTAFVARIAVAADEPAEVLERFEKELAECRVPIALWPSRVVL